MNKLDNIYKKPCISKLTAYAQLCRFHKPVPILLLAWPVLWALWVAANGKPTISTLLIFLAGIIIMRTAGCVINDITDRKLDVHVERTRYRPLANNTISLKAAISLFVILSLIGFGLVLLLNTASIIMAIIVMPLIIIYPWMKRITYWPQLFLGLVYNWGVLMAFTAVNGSYPPLIAWLLYGSAVLWTIAYDTMYALVDREDDLRTGIKSTAVLFAKHYRLVLALFQALVITALIIVGIYLGFDELYYLMIVVAILLMVYQQILITKSTAHNCMNAFLNNNWLGLVIFAGIFFQFIQ